MEIRWKVFLISLIIVYSAAAVGSFLTYENAGSQWYDSIKPSITPPSYIFPIVWNILFFMIALSLYFSWVSSGKKMHSKIASVFGTNLALNVFWSAAFFWFQNPLIAFIILILLWFSILAMIFVVSKVNKVSSYLLVPYLIWVGFAGVLNYLIVFS